MTANITSNSIISTTDNISATGNITATGVFTGGASATDVHSLTGNLNVTGNVEVSGNLNYRNVEDLYVRDQSITLNANAVTDATSSIIINRPVAGSNTVLRWNETDDKWQFTNDGSTYQDLIGLTNLSVTTAAASGGGALSYSNTTGVFTFTPTDLSGAITNAQAQAYIQTNGLAMTANITSNSLISTTGNLQVNPDTVVGGLKGLTFDSSTNRLGLGTTTPSAAIHITSDDDFDSQIYMEEYKDSFFGPDIRSYKARGNISAPTAAQVGDRMLEYRPHGYDGTQFLPTLGMMATVDDANAVTTNILPTVFSWEGYKDGDVTTSYMSMMKLRANGDFQIGSLGFGSSNNAPNFAVTHGGTVDAVGNITSTANVSAGNVIATTGLHGAFLNIPDSSAGTSSIANVEFGSAGANTITIATNGTINFADNNGTIDGVDTFNASNEINCLTGNITAQSNYGINGFLGGVKLHAFNDSANAAYGYGISIGDRNPQAIFSIEQDNSTATKYNNWKKYGGIGSGTDTLHINNHYYRANGTVASPGVIRDGGIVLEDNYHAYDGTQFYKGARSYVIHDNSAGAPATNAVNLSYEFTSIPSVNNEHSRLAICANGAIQFNANSLLGEAAVGTGRNDGNASIALDGTINSVANITATGNISGAYILGNGSQLSGLTTGVTNAQAQSFIQTNGLAMTANITSNSLISTTGNVQFNADTDVSGLSGLTFDSSTNNLGLGTATPGAALHIRGTSNESQIFMTEYNGTSSAGIDLRTFRAGGTEASPTVTPKSDRIWESLHYAYDGVGASGDGISTGFQNAFSEQIITDPSVDHAANLVPVFKQFHTYLDGDATTTPHALMRMRSNGDIQFNMTNAFSYTGAANTVISKDGIITTNGNVTSLANINAAGGTLTGAVTSDSNITTTANVSGNYILGNGSQLTGLTSGGITNAQAQAYIQSNGLAMTSNIDTTASINFTADSSDDTLIKVEADTPSSGTTILDITSARSGDGGPQAFYRKATGSIASPGALGTRDYVYREKFYGHDGTDYLETFGMFVYQDNSSITGGSVSANVVPLAMEFYTEQDGDVNHGFNQSIMRMTPSRTIEFNDTGTRTFGQGYGNANITMDGTINSESDIKAANAVFTDNIFSYTPGGTFTMTSIRVNDFRANDPLGIVSVANSVLSGGVYAAPFTGSIVYVTGDRHGSRGAPAYWSGTEWRYFSDDANVTI